MYSWEIYLYFLVYIFFQTGSFACSLLFTFFEFSIFFSCRTCRVDRSHAYFKETALLKCRIALIQRNGFYLTRSLPYFETNVLCLSRFNSVFWLSGGLKRVDIKPSSGRSLNPGDMNSKSVLRFYQMCRGLLHTTRDTSTSHEVWLILVPQFNTMS